MGEKNIEEGLRWIYKAISTNPRNPHILDTLAEIYFLDSRFEDAVSTQTIALRFAPKNEKLKENLKRYHAALAA